MKVVLQNLTKIFPSRDKKSGNELSRELIRDNHAKVMYVPSNLVVLSENITEPDIK